MDLLEIGGGGGSIASIDELGFLKVGPQSAGADPGPACYGRGGSRATVTDASLVLGYLNPDRFLGGAMKLYPELSTQVLQLEIAQSKGVSVRAAAMSVYRLVNESLASAVRAHCAEKGLDYRKFSLVPFGGAAPTHAVEVARTLGMSQVVVPPDAGILSAKGLLQAPLAFEFAQTYFSSLADDEAEQVDRVYKRLEANGRAMLVNAGVAEDAIKFTRAADVRYRGQAHDLRVLVPGGRIDASAMRRIRQAFNDEYLRQYGRGGRAARIEASVWRVTASSASSFQPRTWTKDGGAPLHVIGGRRRVSYPHAPEPSDASVYWRYDLGPGFEGTGPAIIEEDETTTVIGPDDKFVVDPGGNLVIEVALMRGKTNASV